MQGIQWLKCLLSNCLGLMCVGNRSSALQKKSHFELRLLYLQGSNFTESYSRVVIVLCYDRATSKRYEK